MIGLVIIGYGLLIIIDFVPLYKQKLWKDLWVNSVLGVLSFTVAILLSMGISIPSPEAPIREAITAIFGK